MAAISDVELALRDLIAGVLYPAGQRASDLAHEVKIYAGWPDPQQLDADLVETEGAPLAAHVSIYPLPAERVTTRFSDEWREKPIPTATYQIAAAGQTVTITGAAPNPYFAQNLAVIVSGAPYAVRATAGQSAAQVAQALRAAINADFPGTTVAGAVITLPTSARPAFPAVGVVGEAWRPLRTVEKQFQISVFHSNPEGRAGLAERIDVALAATNWLTYSDGTSGQLQYRGSKEDDFVQKQRIYRRLLIFTVEFTIIATQEAAQIVVHTTNLRDADGALMKTVSI